MKAINQNITRRAALAGAAAMIPATAIPALALASGAGPDPIFAAIEAHKEARAYYRACLDKAEAIEEAMHARADAIAAAEAPEGIPLRQAYCAAKYPGRNTPEDAPEWQEWRRIDRAYFNSRYSTIRRQALAAQDGSPEEVEMHRLQDVGVDREDDAAWAMYETVPTTAAGAAALIWYLLGLEIEGHEMFESLRDYDINGETVTRKAVEAILCSLGEYLETQIAA